MVPVNPQPYCNAAPAAAQVPTLANRGTPVTPAYGYQPCPADGTARLASRPDSNRCGTLPPRYDAATNASLAPAGGNMGQPINITDLPEHGDRGFSPQAAPASATGNRWGVSPDLLGTSKVVQATANMPTDGDRSGAAPRPGIATENSACRALRGRLEYSQTGKHWQLRFSPSNGGVDGTASSVVISNPSALSGYERGDLVEVRGKVSVQNPDGQGSTAQCEVIEIQRVGA